MNNSPALKLRYETHKQSGSSISMLFWGPSIEELRTARAAKYISISSSMSALWLEFAVFSDMSGYLSDIGLSGRCAIFFAMSTLVILFVSRFGLRGFAIADIYLSPIVIIGSVIVLIGIAGVFIRRSSSFQFNDLLIPIVSSSDIILFVCHVLILNSLIVVVSEGHWLRRWAFGAQETNLQRTGTTTTSLLWLVLILAGLIGSSISKEVGEQGVVALLRNMNEQMNNPVFIIAFWAAAVAALFSVSDAQIYSSIVVWNFKISSGEFNHSATRPKNVLVWSVICGLFGTTLYAVVKYTNIPVEKLIFILIPLPINILPAMASRSIGREVQSIPIIFSAAIFLAVSMIGLSQPEHAFSYTLAAILVPVLISFYSYLRPRSEGIA